MPRTRSITRSTASRDRVVGRGWAALLPAMVLSPACSDKSTHGTIPCQHDSDCPQGDASTQPMCAPDSKICVGCLPNCQNTCPNGKICDDQTFQCVAATNPPCHCNS